MVANRITTEVAEAAASTKVTSTTEPYIVVFPGPEDVEIRRLSGELFHQQSVTLTAQMWPPPIEAAGPIASVWGLPTIVWGIFIGCSILVVLALATFLLCCWLLPLTAASTTRVRKYLSPHRVKRTSSSSRTALTAAVAINSGINTSNGSGSSPAVSSGPVAHCPPTKSGCATTSEDVKEQTEAATATASDYIKMDKAQSFHHNQQQHHQQQQHHHHQHHTTNQGLMYHQAMGQPPQYNPPPIPQKANNSTQTNFKVQQQQQQQQQQHYYQLQQKQLQQNYCTQMIQHQQQHNYCQQQQHQGLMIKHNNNNNMNMNNGNNSNNYYRVNHSTIPPASGCQHTNTYTNGTANGHGGCVGGDSPNKKVAAAAAAASSGTNRKSHGSIMVNGSGTHTTTTASMPPEVHKSMWALNHMHSSNGAGLSESETAYRTRSLPSWGKGNKQQRPVSNADDLEELYAKVNFSKKRRNRMRNDEAAIIALCRSRSQNLAGIPLDRDGIVVYDERTAL